MATTPNHTRDAYVRINNWAFPMKAHEGEQELEPGSEVITNALEGFAPSTVAGDASVVDQQSVAVLAFTDWRAGWGFKFSDEAENIGGYSYGNLNTLYPNMAVLPPKQISLGTLPAGYTYSQRSHIFVDPAEAEVVYVWCEFDNKIWRRDAAGVWTTLTLPGGGAQVRGIAYFGYRYWVATNVGIAWSTDMITPLALGWTQNLYGLAELDGKLYTLSANDGKVYWISYAAAASPASPWVNSSSLALNYENDFPMGMYAYKNRANAPVLHIVLGARIVAYDVGDDFFSDFYRSYLPTPAIYGAHTAAAVWEQDQQVYRAHSGSGGTNVLALTDDTISNVSPNKRGGLPVTYRSAVTDMRSSLNYLLALGDTPRPEDYIGTSPIGAPATLGWVLAWNGEGWHPLVEGGSTAATRIRILGYAPNQPLFVKATSNELFGVYFPQFGNLPYDVDARQYAEGTYFLRSAIIDAGHEYTDKTARHFTVYIERQNGTPGIPVNHTAQLWAAWNGGAFAQVGATMTSADTFPKRFPLPGTGNANDPSQVGTIWRTMQWEIRLTKNAGADAYATPIFRGLSLGYVLSPDVFLGFQFVIDLTKERFGQFKGGLFAGKSRRQLRDALYEMTQGTGAKNHYRVEWGWADDYDSVLNLGHREGIIRAAELRLNARENPGTGFGEYTVTGKDVSVKSIDYLLAAEG